MIDHYDWSGGREAMLRFGPPTGPAVVVALPLFEEANRVRAFAVAICRALAKRGVASVLPDLPGQGESLVPLRDVSLHRMRQALETVWLQIEHDRPTHVVALRSGALLDSLCGGARWHLSPSTGADLLRELDKVGRAAAPHGAATAQTDVVEIAGNLMSRGLLDELAGAHPVDSVPVRTVRLETDPRPADRHVPGAPLWRRAEPDNDLALAALLADDIADWIVTCAG